VLRSASHVRQGTREEVVFHVQTRGDALITADGGVSALRPGQLGAVDVTRPYAVRQLGESENSALVVEFSRLDLPVDQIRTAIPALGRSPLRELFREHLLRLDLDLPADAAAMTGQATMHLVAALVASVCDHPRARDVLSLTEPARVAAYIDRHLEDAELTPEQVAAAHGMPARRLAALWRREHGTAPADWIARRRLQRARRLLGDPGLALATLDDIAYACGFIDAADFGRRFLAEYDASPQELRAAASTPHRGVDADLKPDLAADPGGDPRRGLHRA
jgi:AraC-like DNA-binding protein